MDSFSITRTKLETIRLTISVGGKQSSLKVIKMQLDVGSEPTLRLASTTYIDLFFGKVTPNQQKYLYDILKSSYEHMLYNNVCL